MNLSNISKAIAGGLVTAGVSEVARFGWHPQGATVNALQVIVTAVVGYALGHIAVFYAPKNT